MERKTKIEAPDFPSSLQVEGQGGVERRETNQYVKKAATSHLILKKQLRSKVTPAESKLWYYLRAKRFKNLKFRRQHGIGPYIVDYYCPQEKLVIEIDGDVHAFPEQIRKDELREEYLRKRGLQIIRYSNGNVLKNLKGVLEDLYNRVVPSDISPPLCKGRAREG